MGEIYNCNYILVSNQLISLASRENTMVQQLNRQQQVVTVSNQLISLASREPEKQAAIKQMDWYVFPIN